MKKLICWILGHKYREQFVFRDSIETDLYCARCGLNVRLNPPPKPR